MQSQTSNSGQTQNLYASPDEGMPNRNKIARNSPIIPGIPDIPYSNWSTDVDRLDSSCYSVPGTYQPADPPTPGPSVMYHQPTRSCSAYQGPSGFAWSQQPLERVPPTHSQFPNLQTATSPFWIPGQIVPSTVTTNSGLTIEDQPARLFPAYQGPSGFAWSQQPFECVPPTHSQLPNLQTTTPPTGFWNPTIPAQILPPHLTAGVPPPASTMTSTSGFSIEDQLTRSSPAYQGPSGFAWSQQPLERVPPTHSQLPNLQTTTSPTSFWNPTISAQLTPHLTAGVPPPTSHSTMTSTSGFSIEDSAHAPLFAMPVSPPPLVPQSIDLSHFYEDSVHQVYRNIRLKCLLKDPKGCHLYSKVVVRLEERVVLEVHLRAVGERIRDRGWRGIALPRTGSVKQPNQQAPTRLLYFSIGIHGSTTGKTLAQPCDGCWRREMRFLGLPQCLIDFKSDSPFILFPTSDTQPYIKAEVTFHFTCSSDHKKEDYNLVARLHDEQGNMVAYYQIPYSFKSVAQPDRDGGLQEHYTPNGILFPGAFAMPPATGPSTGFHPTTSVRRTANQSGQQPAPERHHRTNARGPAPPPQHPSQRKNFEAQYSSVGAQRPVVGVSSRTGIQQPEAGGPPLLQKVSPIEGPTRGGLNIVLIGMNFPRPTTLYAKFGTAVAATHWLNPYVLECTLPTSPVSGLVDVTLSLSPDQNAQQFGRSFSTFMYRDEQESFNLQISDSPMPLSRAPSPVASSLRLSRPLARFLTSSYVQAGDILRTSRRVEWFSLQALHISRQAFNLIIRFNGSVGPYGPTEEQLDEGLELDDALEELEDKIDELVTLSLDDAHNGEEDHRHDLNRLYQIFFQRRAFFLDERDHRTNRIFQDLAAGDHADIMQAIHLRELNSQQAGTGVTITGGEGEEEEEAIKP